jgi:hydroxyethylthiazole kinase-like uncharacterized protein yjeF
MRLVNTNQMRELEQAAVAAGATWPGLMEQAGRGVADVALSLLPVRSERYVLVLVGPGNNGGDGLVAARYLHDAGVQVLLAIWRRNESGTDANWQACRERGLPEIVVTDADAVAGNTDPAQIAALSVLLPRVDLIIDALLGMGTTRPVSGTLAAIVAAVNERPAGNNGRAGVLAIDMPTGVDSDSGTIRGTAILADHTAATGLAKRGLLCYPGRQCAGHIHRVEIGLSTESVEAIMSETLTPAIARNLLPERPADAHKGSFGKVLVVAGSLNYPGAATLVCSGAARVGAGLVTLASGRTVLAMGGRTPEVTLLPIPEGDWGAIGPNAVEELRKQIDGYAAMVIGPGLGQADPTREFVTRLFGLEQAQAKTTVGFLAGSSPKEDDAEPFVFPPTVIDADGLNLLAAQDAWSDRLERGRFILTPHPGEMRRLLGLEALPEDLTATAVDAAQRWGQVVVLKGATTVIADPDGRNLIFDGGNPALASAGTGDVLAGAIAGLLAQGLTAFDAAALGVYLHGAAGAALRDELGEAGVLAGDLLPQLPRQIKQLRG